MGTIYLSYYLVQYAKTEESPFYIGRQIQEKWMEIIYKVMFRPLNICNIVLFSILSMILLIWLPTCNKIRSDVQCGNNVRNERKIRDVHSKIGENIEACLERKDETCGNLDVITNSSDTVVLIDNRNKHLIKHISLDSEVYQQGGKLKYI